MKNEEIEAFVLTVGEPTFDKCIKSLESQTMLPAEIHVIRNVSPMSEAFNQMNQQAKRKFYLQVDADMVLERDCIESLYKEIITDNKIFLVSGKLFDPIFGDHRGDVKLWRTDIVKDYKFENILACDRWMKNKLREKGYKDISLKDRNYGIHKPDGYSLNELWHTMKRTGEKAVYMNFPDYFLRNFNPLIKHYISGNRAALMGIIAICYGLFTHDFEQKDFHKYESEEYKKVKKLFRM
jgi:hypothetical protein